MDKEEAVKRIEEGYPIWIWHGGVPYEGTPLAEQAEELEAVKIEVFDRAIMCKRLDAPLIFLYYDGYGKSWAFSKEELLTEVEE